MTSIQFTQHQIILLVEMVDCFHGIEELLQDLDGIFLESINWTGIELELNCKDKPIKYYDNEKDFGVGYNKIATEFKTGDCTYSFAVAFASASVELLQFDEVEHDYN